MAPLKMSDLCESMFAMHTRTGFTFTQAVTSGVRPQILSDLTRERKLHRITRGGYYIGDEPGDLRARIEVINAVLPKEIVVGRRSAAYVWGLNALPPGRDPASLPVVVLTPPEGPDPPDRRGIVPYITALPDGDVTEAGGIRVTTEERTALDCARWLPPMDAVAVLDQFLRRGVDPGALEERAIALKGRRNVKRLREILSMGDAGAQSPRESHTRVRILDADLPRPQTQIPVMLPTAKIVYVDMGWEEYRTGVEYDGEEFHGPDREAYDRWRRAELAKLGWTIFVVKNADLAEGTFVWRVGQHLQRRGWRPGLTELGNVLERLKNT